MKAALLLLSAYLTVAVAQRKYYLQSDQSKKHGSTITAIQDK